MAVTTMAKHGATFREVPTSIISPIEATSGLNVVIGAAPVHQLEDWSKVVNVPVRCNSMADAQELLGYSDEWTLYPLCEHMDAAFAKFGIQPVVYINVLDPAVHILTPAPAPVTVTLVGGTVNTGRKDIILSTLVVKDSPGATITYVKNTDYLTSWSDDYEVVITWIEGGAIPSATSPLQLTFSAIDSSMIAADDIIGGVDATTGEPEGIEAVELVFGLTGLIPGILLAPKFSDDPSVAATLETKCQSINGCFMCRTAIDVDASVVRAIDVLPWKTSNNIVSPNQDCCWPYLGIPEGDIVRKYHFSTQWGCLQMHTDATRYNNIPYGSPSNKPIKATQWWLGNDTEYHMTKPNADMLNSQGIVTALNWAIYGMRGWGNRTAAGGGISSDVKDVFIPNKRMSHWIGNTVVLTLHQYVDEPGNRRLIDVVVNSINRWLNGLQAEGAILGGRMEFRQDENPTDQLLDGHYVFHIYYLSPTPAEWIETILEVDVTYFETLFATAA
jgi:Bacteriophage tail sheath protein